MPHLGENILLNYEFKNEATRANLLVNKRILKWWPFWNKVHNKNYSQLFQSCMHFSLEFILTHHKNLLKQY